MKKAGLLLIIAVLLSTAIPVWGESEDLLQLRDFSAKGKLIQFEPILKEAGCVDYEWWVYPIMGPNSAYHVQNNQRYIIVTAGLLTQGPTDVLRFLIAHEAYHCVQDIELGKGYDLFDVVYKDHPYSFELDADIRATLLLCRMGYGSAGLRETGSMFERWVGPDWLNTPGKTHPSWNARVRIMEEIIQLTSCEVKPLPETPSIGAPCVPSKFVGWCMDGRRMDID